jgi:hypothetical protein
MAGPPRLGGGDDCAGCRRQSAGPRHDAAPQMPSKVTLKHLQQWWPRVLAQQGVCGPVLDRYTCLQCSYGTCKGTERKENSVRIRSSRSAVLTKFIAHLFCILHIHSNTLINMSLQKPKISSLLCLVSFACTALPPWSALVFAAECLSDRALVSCRKRTIFTRCHFCS